ncbi:ATPase complex subunit 9 [Taxawa tesnikishii (nom. ined.)]|nr:ATPase complex subunit 9 [Dothideales sp. JES 119]
MASRVFAPKMASMVAQTSVKAARPAFRSAVKPQQVQRFSAVSQAVRQSPFQAIKRQQPSQIAARLNKTSSRQYSSEIADAMVQVSQNMGMGSAAIGLGGAGIGIGLVFGALLLGVSRNPALRGQLFSYAILGFAFVEAIGLFDLMVAMMCKYV